MIVAGQGDTLKIFLVMTWATERLETDVRNPEAQASGMSS